MKHQFFPAENSGQATGVPCYKNRKAVEAEAGRWAAVIVKVDGGWAAWESVEDYNTWRKQK